MTRNEIKSKDYFNDYIERQLNRISKYVDAIHINNYEVEQLKNLRSSICDISLHELIAEYSRGDNVEKIKDTYCRLILTFEEGWKNVGGYVHMLWMLSIGVLLEVNDHDFHKLIKLVDSSHMKDYLIDYLISNKIDNRKISSKVMFEDPYKRMVDITKMDKNLAQANMYQYLEKYWYKGHSDSYWYGNHQSKHNTYFGYWSFESGALVKILGLDDSVLKNCPYYPYDMVHWKEDKSTSKNSWTILD
ncbi:MAG: DUF1911 domain-containing protein [Dysgonamonadaceae bacterium]|jgi:hypothetical protein|nr:DUF1911 domain-containing protein [Dysgonamonadaceae bacterium]